MLCARPCGKIQMVLVGEMRDLETIRLAMTAAETGHLVLERCASPRLRPWIGSSRFLPRKRNGARDASNRTR
jgi:hypothetical protein